MLYVRIQCPVQHINYDELLVFWLVKYESTITSPSCHSSVPLFQMQDSKEEGRLAGLKAMPDLKRDDPQTTTRGRFAPKVPSQRRRRGEDIKNEAGGRAVTVVKAKRGKGDNRGLGQSRGRGRGRAPTATFSAPLPSAPSTVSAKFAQQGNADNDGCHVQEKHSTTHALSLSVSMLDELALPLTVPFSSSNQVENTTSAAEIKSGKSKVPTLVDEQAPDDNRKNLAEAAEAAMKAEAEANKYVLHDMCPSGAKTLFSEDDEKWDLEKDAKGPQEEEQLVLIQFPPSLPIQPAVSPTARESTGVDVGEGAPTQPRAPWLPVQTQTEGLNLQEAADEQGLKFGLENHALKDSAEGKIGALRVHRSGALSLAVGSSTFQVMPGTKSMFWAA
mmetsp:Transcript_18002/g.44668  ORF Transcript_18002/g.44668 Transcript_18002/m.44668 type:complete len:388 (-) Transcript_18002:2100-3263(-)